MTSQRIEPHKVTKPMQLLAAWLVGLIITNAIFLTSAIQFSSSSWERGALVISAIINVPIFLFALFVLQTRFRAELQEDTFYSEYLSKKSASNVRVEKSATFDSRIDELERQLLHLVRQKSFSVDGPINTDTAHVDWSNWPIALNKHHPKFKELREGLKAANIPLASIFDGHGEPPEKWIVSLSYHMPVSNKARLLEVILPYGFDGINFWEPVREAGENEDAYIGGYGAGQYASVTQELLELVKKEIEPVDLEYYYDQHKIGI